LSTKQRLYLICPVGLMLLSALLAPSMVGALTTDQQEKTEAYYRTGVSYIPQGDSLWNASQFKEADQAFLEAARNLNHALEIDTCYMAAYNAIGIAFLRLRQYSNVEISMNRAIKCNPDNAFAHRTLGDAIYLNTLKDKRVQEAIQLWRESLVKETDTIQTINLIRTIGAW
jgi:tetratricopeptide (TPR) repeat protein